MQTKDRLKKLSIVFNPISAGVLENQDMLGGGSNWPPPSKSHVWCPNMTNDTSLESPCALLLESAKKMQICKNWIFYRKIQLYSKNVCKIKFVQKMKNYTFLKSPWHKQTDWTSFARKKIANFLQPTCQRKFAHF